MALGSGVSAPTNSDIHLQTETVRGLITNAETDANIVFLDKFRTQAEVAGNTYLEA